MRNVEKRWVSSFFVLFVMLAFTPSLMASGARPVVITGLRMVTVKVKAVDAKKGTLTVKDDKGNQATLNLGNKVHDLDKVKPGDTLALELYRSVVVELLPPGEKPTREMLAPVDIATRDGKAGFKNVKILTAKVKIVDIDRAKRTVTLKTEHGTFELNVCKKAKNFGKVKKGEDALALVTDPIILSIRKLEPK